MTTTAKPGTLAQLKVEVSGDGYGTVSVTGTAKLVRYWLKTEFPGTRFQVKSSRYSMGASLDVFWTDGPAVAEVEAVVAPFAGQGFDGMTDGTTHNMAWLFPDGRAVRFASEIGHSAGSVVRDAGGNKLDREQQHDYMAGLMIEVQGSTTRSGYDPDSYEYRLGQADARQLTAAGARLVSFHAGGIDTHRAFGPEYRARLEQAVVFLAGQDGEFDGNARYEFALDDGPREGRVFSDYGHTLVYQLSRLDDPADLDAAIAAETARRASTTPPRVTVSAADWDGDPDILTLPDAVIVNAPQPLAGFLTWTGQDRHGTFYAAAPHVAGGPDPWDYYGWRVAGARQVERIMTYGTSAPAAAEEAGRG